jgi:hypothetical protein
MNQAVNCDNIKLREGIARNRRTIEELRNVNRMQAGETEILIDQINHLKYLNAMQEGESAMLRSIIDELKGVKHFDYNEVKRSIEKMPRASEKQLKGWHESIMSGRKPELENSSMLVGTAGLMGLALGALAVSVVWIIVELLTK